MARSGDRTRLKIEAAALMLFAEKGVDQASIRDIASRADIAEGTLYRHYAGKDALIWSLFSTNYADLAERLDAAGGGGVRLRGGLAAMVRTFCAFFDDDPAMFRFLLLVQHGQLPHIPAGMRTPVSVVRDALARAMARGEIAARDPDIATAIVLGIVLQTATFHVYGRVSQPMRALAETLGEACWRALEPMTEERHP